MNFNIGSPSESLYFDGENADDDANLINYIEVISAEEESRITMNANNNICMVRYLIQLNKEAVHRGSVLGHRTINCDRESVDRHDNYFVQRRDVMGKLGLSSLQKITAVFRMLAYDIPADAADEYIKIGESTTIESLKRFYRAIVELFTDQYLISPNANGISRLLHLGSNNEINVLEASHLFSNLASGIAPPAHYVIQGKEYNTSYYLADGIYPKWSTLVQTIHDPRGTKKKHFSMKQESCRNDVECAFGVLQSRLLEHHVLGTNMCYMI
ncbi:uncharacterized protein LOC133805681 [Humulus lupulus]|uniref:uncharacterized protein LOC133805681 n=1 Tax=Humulus lupulus TaxID=3486 RepID=UPI002B415A7F|nr:uncharacterized protein LOC133805681 [Humulus lupulus]